MHISLRPLTVRCGPRWTLASASDGLGEAAYPARPPKNTPEVSFLSVFVRPSGFGAAARGIRRAPRGPCKEAVPPLQKLPAAAEPAHRRQGRSVGRGQAADLRLALTSMDWGVLAIKACSKHRHPRSPHRQSCAEAVGTTQLPEELRSLRAVLRRHCTGPLPGKGPVLPQAMKGRPHYRCNSFLELLINGHQDPIPWIPDGGILIQTQQQMVCCEHGQQQESAM